MAIGSRRSEGNADELRPALAMLKLLSQYPQRKYLGFSHGFVGRCAISKNARKSGDFRKPSTVFLLFIFNAEIHRIRATVFQGNCGDCTPKRGQRLPRPRFFWTRSLGKQSLSERKGFLMSEEKKEGVVPGTAAGGKRWSANRRKEVVLRLLRGESVDALSRELGVGIYRLEQWRERALAALDSGLPACACTPACTYTHADRHADRRERGDDPLTRQLDQARHRIGELAMEIGILRREREHRRPLALRRSSR